ncbi:hypothetical protein N7527_006619 [Penicillium freii]|nr:hypothetical protein N7527_006619 [Penicillium freii]
MLGMKFKPLHTTFLGPSTRADLKSPISATSERPTQLDSGTDTVIMSDTCTEIKPSPSTLTDPSAEGNREIKTSTSTQCDTVAQNVIMPETSTATGPKSPSVDLISSPAQENLEAGISATWDIPAEYDSDSDSDIQTVILCDNPSEGDSPQISSSSQKDPSAMPNTSSDDSSSRDLDISSGGKSETSSIDTVGTRPESPTSALFNTSAYENCESKTSTTPDVPTQYDSDSDIQTVILCDDASENEANTPQNSSSNQKEPSTESNTSSDDSPDDSSDDSSVGSSLGSSNNSSVAKSESSSIDSVDTSPKSPHIALFNPSSQENCEVQIRTTSQKSTQYDSNSDAQTVILCDDTSDNGTNTLRNSSFSQKEPNTISSTSSDDSPVDSPVDSPDDSSDGSSSWASDSSCGAKSESSSIDSFDRSSQNDSESEEEELPKGSQMLAAYASPLRDGQRIRTSCDSIYDPGRWLVDPDGFINEKYRAGGPFLCCLPETILNLKGSSPLMAVLENISLVKMIFSVLEEYQVNASSVKIKRCQYELWPILQPLATLIITATRDTFSDNWVQACREIWRRLSEHELGYINVEISDPSLHSPFHFWPVEKKHPYFSKHRDVIEKITNELHLTDLLSIAAFRIGTTPDVKDSEVFMFLEVDFKSEQDWRGPREQIVSILEELKLPMVGVVVQKGKM